MTELEQRLSEVEKRKIAADAWARLRNVGGLFYSEIRDDMACLAEACVQEGYSLALARQSAMREKLKDAVVAAYIAGASDVHSNWQEDRDPDFTEAAYDYASTLGERDDG